MFGAGALARFAGYGIDLNLVLIVLGCVTILYGEFRALFETELKRMLAFSSLAQIGELVAILGVGTVLATDAALLHVTNHAVMKTLLFYSAGAFIMMTGIRRIADLSGLGHVMPFSAGAYALASFAIMGLPPFSGFISKFLMIYAAASGGHLEVAATILFGGIIGLVYYTRVVRVLFFQPYAGEVKRREAPASMLVAIGVLAAAIVAGGLMPGFQLEMVGRVGEAVAARSGTVAAALPGLVASWPVGSLIAIIGAGAVWITGRRSIYAAGWLAVGVLVLTILGIIGPAGPLRPALVRLRDPDCRRRRAQHVALDRLSRRRRAPVALLRRLHGDDGRPDRHGVGQGRIHLLHVLGGDEQLGDVDRAHP